MLLISYHDNWEIVLVKKKKNIYIIWGLKNIIVTLYDYLLSHGGSNGDGDGDDGSCHCCLL